MKGMKARTYLVTDPRLCGARGVVETVRLAVEGGVGAVQLRDPEASTRELCRLGDRLRATLDGTGVPLIVDDRVDVALAIGADGVHVGQSDLPALAAREILGDDGIVGLSVSTVAEVVEATALAVGVVDYLGVGPVLATPTKPDASAPVGLDGTRHLVAAAGHLPCIAIGGIDAANVEEVRSTGVVGVAVVSAICAADDPVAAAALIEGTHR